MSHEYGHTWKFQATIVRIIDGDTFAADFDLGLGIWRREVKGAPCRVRILGYNAPERSDPEYASAVLALTQWLPVGSRCWVESVQLDSFGRVLGNIYLPDGTNLLTLLPAQWRIPVSTRRGGKRKRR